MARVVFGKRKIIIFIIKYCNVNTSRLRKIRILVFRLYQIQTKVCANFYNTHLCQRTLHVNDISFLFFHASTIHTVFFSVASCGFTQSFVFR